MKIFFIFIGLLFIFSLNLFAQEEVFSEKNGVTENKTKEIKRELTINFIFDQTKTKVGRDFYETFSLSWEFPPDFPGNIKIEEYTDPRWGTVLYLYVEDTLLYATPLKPRFEDIEGKVEEAIDVLWKYYFAYKEQQKTLSQPFY
jgi:curli production assembly/transport component CsgE